MKVNLTIKPKDYLINYSPTRKAKLYLFFQEKTGNILSNIYEELLKYFKMVVFSFFINPCDLECEKVWKKLKEKGYENDRKNIINLLHSKFNDDHLRKYEYAFEAEYLQKFVKKGAIIVDMGGGFSYSTIVPILLKLPDTKIISLDVVNYFRKSKYNVEFRKGDCCNTHLPSASVDMITAISTLEHVGLGRYGDPLDPDGDLNAMKEAHRILKPKGYLIVTIPYGYPSVVYNLHRVYDEGRLKLLIRGFKVRIAKYTRYGKVCLKKDIEGKPVVKRIPGFYQDVPEDKSIYNSQGGALLLLQKI